MDLPTETFNTPSDRGPSPGHPSPGNFTTDLPSTDHPGQPNLDTSISSATSSVRFWFTVAITGLLAGIVGGILMRLLSFVEQTTWRFTTGTLLDAAAVAPPRVHIISLLTAGVIVGAGGLLIRRLLGKSTEAEAAIWFRSGQIPMLPALVRAIQSIVAVGMGTSLGRESPIKQTGGAIASTLGRRFALCRAEQRLLTACGVGAGMAAAYNVPVGGALFTAEVLLGSISLRLAMPALLCSGLATVSSWALLPASPVYRVPEYPLSASLTLWAILAGPILGLATVPVVQAIGWASAHRPTKTIGAILIPILVLTALGVVSIPYPQLLGNGKDDVQLAYSDQFSFSLLLVLPLLKLLSTTTCLGAGASGGLFTPTMTIGAMMGGLLGHLWEHIWPGASMGSCSVIGSCAFLAAATQGPISSLVLVLELTRHLDGTMAPMLLAVTGAMLVGRQIESRSIYSIRLPELNPSQTHQPSFSGRVISSATSAAQTARKLLSQSDRKPLAVVDHRGELVGTISYEAFFSADLQAVPIEAAQAGDLAQ